MPTFIIYDIDRMILTPRLSHFLCVTLKNWEEPENKAKDVQVHGLLIAVLLLLVQELTFLFLFWWFTYCICPHTCTCKHVGSDLNV